MDLERRSNARSFRLGRRGWIAASVFALASACIVTPAAEVEFAPPAPLFEPVVVAPSPTHVWVGGYWEYRDRWAWSPGRWVAPPHPHAAWTPGRWEPRGSRWGWKAGHW